MFFRYFYLFDILIIKPIIKKNTPKTEMGIQKRKQNSANLMMKRGKSPRAVNIDTPTINISIDSENMQPPKIIKYLEILLFFIMLSIQDLVNSSLSFFFRNSIIAIFYETVIMGTMGKN